jgi:ATP-binding cassette, subfamily F, member 3
MISLQNVTLRHGATVLIENLNWTIYHKQHIGIIGENGCGKSSLFSMLLGELQPDSGDLEIPRQLKFAHVAQETPAYQESALEFVIDGDYELRTLEKELLKAEQANDGEHIATLHTRLSEIDAYTATARAAQLLNGLGFSPLEQSKPVSDFSGGWRVRLNLAHALMCRSDILLLDEPTNHLDLDAVLWLETWLSNYHGTLLLISHDRDFLDKVVDHVAHISHCELKLYTGNYSSFEKQRAEQLIIQQSAYEKQQKQIAHMQDFVTRFKAKASKARQAQSRLKAIERMELVSAVHQDSPFQFHFKKPAKCPNPLLTMEYASVAYGDNIILHDLNLQLTPHDRIALLGPNGAGKSSLVKLLAGELITPTGMLERGPGLKIGYFAQHQVDHLILNETPLHHLQELAPDLNEKSSRTFLGSFGFSGTRVLEPIKNFSGGEKSRLALALLIFQQPNLLLLDEPTNHLDLEMRHALSIALQEYQGAMILVSHDRFLTRTTVDQLMLVAEGTIKNFEGDLNDYQQWLLEFRKAEKIEKSAKPQVSKKAQRQLDAEQRELRRPLMLRVKALENELEKLRKKANAIELLLADLSLYDGKNKELLQRHLLDQAKIKGEIETTETEWLKACENL